MLGICKKPFAELYIVGKKGEVTVLSNRMQAIKKVDLNLAEPSEVKESS